MAELGSCGDSWQGLNLPRLVRQMTLARTLAAAHDLCWPPTDVQEGQPTHQRNDEHLDVLSIRPRANGFDAGATDWGRDSAPDLQHRENVFRFDLRMQFTTFDLRMHFTQSRRLLHPIC